MSVAPQGMWAPGPGMPLQVQRMHASRRSRRTRLRHIRVGVGVAVAALLRCHQEPQAQQLRLLVWRQVLPQAPPPRAQQAAAAQRRVVEQRWVQLSNRVPAGGPS